MKRVLWAATVASIACLAACGDDGTNEPPPPPGTPGTAMVGPSGGSVAATLAGGGSVALTVPAGAVDSLTAFAIEPIAPVAPALATFRLRPAAVVFDGELTLAVTLPPGRAVPELATLSYRVGTARVLVPVTVDRPSRRVEARLRSLGTAADAPLALRLAAAPGDAEFSFDAATIATMIAAADAAVTRMEVQQTIEAADALNTTMSAVTQIPATPALESQVRPLYNRWRDAVCTRFAAAITQYAAVSTASPFDFPDYERETKVMVAWTGVVKELEALAPAALLQICTQGSAAGITAIGDKTDQFIPRIQAIIDATDVRVRFNEVIENRIPIFLRLERDVTLMELVALVPKVRELSGRFLDRLRAAGYGFCAQVGHLYYLARLLEEEQSSAELLSNYDEASLVADLGACATALQWRALDSLGGTVAQGTLGGTAPDVAVLHATTTLPIGGSIRLEGLVRPLQCTGTSQFDFTLNQESLRFDVRKGLLTQSAGTQPLPSGLPAEYFRNGPAILTATQLRSTVGLAPSDATTIELRVVRVGNTCGFPMDALGSTSMVASLTLSDTTGPQPFATGGYDGTVTATENGQPIGATGETIWWLLPEGNQFYLLNGDRGQLAPLFFPFQECVGERVATCSGLFSLPSSGGSFQVGDANGAATWAGTVSGGALDATMTEGAIVVIFTGTLQRPFP